MLQEHNTNAVYLLPKLIGLILDTPSTTKSLLLVFDILSNRDLNLDDILDVGNVSTSANRGCATYDLNLRLTARLLKLVVSLVLVVLRDVASVENNDLINIEAATPIISVPML